MTDPGTCPLCGKIFGNIHALKAHLFSPRHKDGQDILDKIDWLIANLQEAQRAIDIYRMLAREQSSCAVSYALDALETTG